MGLTRHHFAIAFQKAKVDFLADARRGYLGLLWWALEPILYMLVFYLLFVVITKRFSGDAVGFLLCGLVVWKWFAATIIQCANSIPSNAGLIRQVYVPKAVFPLAILTTNTMKFGIVLGLFLIYLVIKGSGPTTSWISIPVIIIIQYQFTFAIGGILAVVTPFLPDLKQIIENVVLLLFFLSGIIFDITKVSPEMRVYLQANPMVGFIDNFRSILVHGLWPDWAFLLGMFVVSLVGIMVASKLLSRYDRVYAKIV